MPVFKVPGHEKGYIDDDQTYFLKTIKSRFEKAAALPQVRNYLNVHAPRHRLQHSLITHLSSLDEKITTLTLENTPGEITIKLIEIRDKFDNILKKLNNITMII